VSKLFDPARVTPEGRELGENIARLIQPAIEELAAMGEPDVRCATCAFRAGTVPNGCAQTLMDAMKCVMEGSRVFLCHQDTSHQTVCHGYFAARFAGGAKDRKVPWDYSPDPTDAEVRDAIADVNEHIQQVGP
jgi:hypothetical protein